MSMTQKDVIIVGGGPAGLAAAVELYKQGITDILIIEREKNLGGILNQCIHDGFGLTRFKETLSGPEYAGRFIAEVEQLNIPYVTETTVIDVTNDKIVRGTSTRGVFEYQAKAVILTMGCRERTRGAISIPGTRPAGIYTAGVAQSYMNLHNRMIGREAVILGSGDIGLIMARRLTLEGAKVKGVFEIQPYPNGLPRNVDQCLNDYNIPLYLSHTVTDIKGRDRLESVIVSQVDENYNYIAGTEQEFTCDTLILSVGLIPENELSIAAGISLDNRTKGAFVDEYFQTNVEGIFAAGNVLQVHDLVDFVSLEAENMANSVVTYLSQDDFKEAKINIKTDENISHTIPQKISGNKDFKLSLRVKKPTQACRVEISQGGQTIKIKKLKKAIPAEMIQIPIKQDKISKNEDLEVSVIC